MTMPYRRGHISVRLEPSRRVLAVNGLLSLPFRPPLKTRSLLAQDVHACVLDAHWRVLSLDCRNSRGSSVHAWDLLRPGLPPIRLGQISRSPLSGRGFPLPAHVTRPFSSGPSNLVAAVLPMGLFAFCTRPRSCYASSVNRQKA